MNLPGKLVLGFLQEDNPLKGYFRVRPLLMEEESEFILMEDAEQTFLEDGYIRIVPDKNELSHFKSRMRSLGQYCLIDLRKHTGENDKIRPNKNYQRDDRNTYIVYSDVIQRLPDTYMAEVYENNEFARPGTAYVMLKNGETLDGPYEWEEVDENSARLAAHVPADPDIAAPEKTRRIKCVTPLGERTFLMRLDALGVRETPAEPAHHAVRIAPPPAPEEATEASAPTPADAPAPAAEPAWIEHVSFPPVRAILGKVTTREQSLIMQSGINPKRGASMRDVVDDQWRQSRMDQLGHPIPACSSAQPVLSPVEDAVRAFNLAWEEPNARPGLVRELLRNEELTAALELVKENPETEDMRIAAARLTDLEAEKLKMLSELDHLRRDRLSLRESVREELKKEYAGKVAQLEDQCRSLEGRAAAARAAVEDARQAAQAADDAYASVINENTDEKLCQALLQSRAAGLLKRAVFGAAAAPATPETETLSAGEMVSALRVRFENAGIPLENDDAVHLLVCLALGRILAFSGPSGSQKTDRVRALAASLGITGSGRFSEIRVCDGMASVAEEISLRGPDGLPQIRRPDVKQTLDTADELTLSMLLLDDANRADVDSLLGEMMTLGEPGATSVLHGAADAPLSASLRVALTALDMPEGRPLSPALLNRAWFTRVYPAAEDAPWQPVPQALPDLDQALSLSCLQSTFAPTFQPSEEILQRMAALRKALSQVGVRLSRRALDDTWRYCAAARPYMRCDDRELLDRALCCRAIPWVLATAELPALHALPQLLAEYPRCLQLMEQPLPMPPV